MWEVKPRANLALCPNSYCPHYPCLLPVHLATDYILERVQLQEWHSALLEVGFSNMGPASGHWYSIRPPFLESCEEQTTIHRLSHPDSFLLGFHRSLYNIMFFTFEDKDLCLH